MSFGDQAVDHHRPVLADAVRAVGGLVLDGGVPPRVDQEHVVGGGEVEAGAAGLERDQHHRRAVVGLEARRPRRRDRACEPSRRMNGDAGALQVRLDRDRAARSTARTPAPCGRRRRRPRAPRAARSTFDDAGRAAGPGTSAGWQAAWRSRSSASSAAMHAAAGLRAARRSSLLRRGAHRVVDAALALARARRAARRRCAAAARARPRASGGAARTAGCARAAAPRRRASPSAIGLGVALLEVAAAAEQAAVGEVELAPQLVEPVLDRRAGQGDAEARRAARRRRARPGCRGS